MSRSDRPLRVESFEDFVDSISRVGDIAAQKEEEEEEDGVVVEPPAAAVFKGTRRLLAEKMVMEMH